MSDQRHENRMQEILRHEQDFRQRGIVDINQAHDDIDYLYTRVRLLSVGVEKWEELGELGFGVICNSKPDPSLDDPHSEGYWIAMRKYLDDYHEQKERGKD